ncbi:hypothetical protein OLU52_03265 [Campylobacter jejuni]|nr:hypothetical protein [Campylobacter jejuni]
MESLLQRWIFCKFISKCKRKKLKCLLFFIFFIYFSFTFFGVHGIYLFGYFLAWGLFFVFIFQLVDFKDACFVFSLVWDSSLTLVGLIILSFSLEALGFFDFIASKILYFSREKNQEKIYISTKKNDVIFVDFCIFFFLHFLLTMERF